MPFAQALFGVGALSSPLFVRLLEIKSYYLFGNLSLFLTILYVLYPPPEIHGHKAEKASQKNLGTVSDNLVVLFAIAFLVEVGIEMTVSGWFSSYAVLTGTFDSK